MDTHLVVHSPESSLWQGQRKLDYKFAPKANRRPSQSRASLKTQEKHKFTKREKSTMGKNSGTPRIGRILG